MNKKGEMNNSEYLYYRKDDHFISDDSGNFTANDTDGSQTTAVTPDIDTPPPGSQSAGLSVIQNGCFSPIPEYLSTPPSTRNSKEFPYNSQLKAIFENFNELYHDKMTWIDENMTTDANVHAKKNVLEDWVKDLIEQNNILIGTVEDLEVEAGRKVQNLQKRVQEAAEITREHMTVIMEYEEQMKQLLKENHAVKKQEQFYRKESNYLEKEKRRVLDKLHSVKNDNSSLVTLIHRVRDTGIWDTNGLSISPHTYDSIFGLYPSLPGNEVQTVFTRQKVKNLEKAELDIAQLMTQANDHNNQKKEVENQLLEKTKLVESLQNDVQKLYSKVQQYESERGQNYPSVQPTKDDLTNGDLTQTTDSSDGWDWNVDEEDSKNSTETPAPPKNIPPRTSHQDYDIAQLLVENERLQTEKNNLAQQNSTLKREKLKNEAAHKKEMGEKEVEGCTSSFPPSNHDQLIQNLSTAHWSFSRTHFKDGSSVPHPESIHPAAKTNSPSNLLNVEKVTNVSSNENCPEKEDACHSTHNSDIGLEAQDPKSNEDQTIKADKNFQNDQVQKLIWLVTALRRKLKKRKDLETQLKNDNDFLRVILSNVSCAWDELRKCCADLRKQVFEPCEEVGFLSGTDPFPSPYRYSEGMKMMSKILGVLEECVNNMAKLLGVN